MGMIYKYNLHCFITFLKLFVYVHGIHFLFVQYDIFIGKVLYCSLRKNIIETTEHNSP